MNDFSDFFGQLAMPFLTTCGVVIALVGALLALNFRNRAKIREAKARETGAKSASSAASVSVDASVLPDLDALLDVSGLEPSPSPVQRQSPQSSMPIRSGPEVRLKSGQRVRAEEVIGILRDPRDGRLIVRLDGIGYRTLLDDPDVREKFAEIMQELSAAIVEEDNNEFVEEVIPEAPTPVEPPRPIQAESPPKPSRDKAQTDERARSGAAAPGSFDLPKYKLEDSGTMTQSGMFGRAKFEAQPIPELNIAAAIEAYIQYKLQESPKFAHREIHIHPADGGGVRIQVDNLYYDAVSDVADTEVREFLSSAIQEWQDRQ